MTWTTLTFPFGSVLTSTKMTQLYDNFAAMAAGDSGAPSILRLPVSSQTASSSATIEFTGIGSTYSLEVYELLDVIPATDASNLLMEVGTGAGPTWSTTGYYDHAPGEANKATFSINQTSAGDEVGNAAGQGLSARIIMWKPATTTYHKFWSWATYIRSSDDIPFWLSHGMLWGGTSPITGVRWRFSSGNISSGNFRRYGFG